MRLYSLLFLIILNIIYSEQTIKCPSVCKCKSTIVKCTGQSLKAIPIDIPVDVTKLDLSNNLLKSLPPRAFIKLSKLKTLKINKNEMKLIEPDAFQGLSNLRELFLVNNDLSNLPANIFKWNKKLLHLYLSDNEFESIPKLNSPSLTRINLDKNRINSAYIDKSFLASTALQTIILTNNQLGQIQSKDFENLRNTQIHTLNLRNNEIVAFHNQSLAPIQSNLMNLELRGNPKLGTKQVAQALLPLKGSNSMLYLDLSDVGLTVLPAQFFHSLEQSRIHRLDLHNNRQLTHIDPRTFIPLSNRLQYLNISHCSIKDPSNIKFSTLNRLLQLDLSHNLIYKLPSHLPTSLTHLLLQSNQLNSFSVLASPHWLTNLKYLDLSANQIQAISISSLQHLSQLFLTSNKLSVLYYNSIFLLPNLDLIQLSNQSPCLRNIQISAFHHLPGLTSLDLESNCLTTLPNICSDIPSLRYIQLKQNEFTALNDTTFGPCSNLIGLDLSSNLLSQWSPGTFQPMKRLSHLDLADNKLTNVSTDSHRINYLKSRGWPSNTTIRMNNNQWNCSIEGDNINWIRRHRVLIKDVEDIVCSSISADPSAVDRPIVNKSSLPLHHSKVIGPISSATGNNNTIGPVSIVFIILATALISGLVIFLIIRYRSVIILRFRNHSQRNHPHAISSILNIVRSVPSSCLHSNPDREAIINQEDDLIGIDDEEVDSNLVDINPSGYHPLSSAITSTRNIMDRSVVTPFSQLTLNISNKAITDGVDIDRLVGMYQENSVKHDVLVMALSTAWQHSSNINQGLSIKYLYDYDWMRNDDASLMHCLCTHLVMVQCEWMDQLQPDYTPLFNKIINWRTNHSNELNSVAFNMQQKLGTYPSQHSNYPLTIYQYKLHSQSFYDFCVDLLYDLQSPSSSIHI